MRHLSSLRRATAVGSALVAAGLTAVTVAPGALGLSSRSTGGGHVAFAKTEKLTRTHLVDGQDQVVDRRTFSVTVDQTQALRDRQEINVAWTGAHPTGGIVGDVNSSLAAEQEYPVVLMMCRGLASSAAPAAKRISPKTCFTQTPTERYQSDYNNAFPAYRVDRYATAADRAARVGLPDPLPKECSNAKDGIQHWVPFVAEDGTVYHGGLDGCGGIPPESVNIEGSLQPGETTYGDSDKHGYGQAKFVIDTAESNGSLGCSNKIACSLVVVPIMGIDCDVAGNSIPPDERPQSDDQRQQAYKLCSATGKYTPGQLSSGFRNVEDLAVSGELWWSASNWRNRITVPLNFAPPSNVCSLANTSTPTTVYGSELLLQATQQWAPYFCLNASLFKFQHVQTSEPQAKNLLQQASVNAAFAANAPPDGFSKPIVQAPTALTGFAISYDIDDADGHPYTKLRLDARLLAKLLTESYSSNASVQSSDPKLRNPTTHEPNPIDMPADPEFQALNPGLPTTVNPPEAASTLLAIAADSDIMRALTSYINADPEARAWLNGQPDPWGMVVNPAYRHLPLPVDIMPLLDTFEPKDLYTPQSNACLAQDPVPWLPLVAAPISNPATITLNLQFGIANSQINCINPGSLSQKLSALGREIPGQRFVLGVTSLADADRYELDNASLQTHNTSTSTSQFTSAEDRSFAGPDDAGLRAAATALTPDKATGTWPVPYAKLRSDSSLASAYPGTMLVSTDVPVSGLSSSDAAKYAQLLQFFAGRGQQSGVGNGDLPEGYLPMTSSNGLGKEAAYTQRAAAAVRTQSGVVPSVLGDSNSAGTKKGNGGGSKTSSASNSGGQGGSNAAGGGSGQSAAGGGSGQQGGGNSVGITSQTGNGQPATSAVSLGRTADVASSRADVVVPIVLILGLLAGTATLLLTLLGRPRVQP